MLFFIFMKYARDLGYVIDGLYCVLIMPNGDGQAIKTIFAAATKWVLCQDGIDHHELG
jgi:hypothetical protein